MPPKFLFLTLILFCSAALADDRYYMWIYAHQARVGNLPRHSHTYGVFARTENGRLKDSRTISWMAKHGFHLLGGADTGENMSLRKTFGIVSDMGYRWWKFGPYEIKAELYERAKRRVDEIFTPGKILYDALAGGRPSYSTNCIHAISDLDRDFGPLVTGTKRGYEASTAVVRHLNRWIISHDGVPNQLRSDLADSLQVSAGYF